MKPCPDRKEILWLDVYGELGPNDRAAWEKHLEICEGCRQEREQLISLLQSVKTNTPSPVLSREEERTLSRSITRELRRDREERWWQKRLWGVPYRLVPAVAAASILVVVFGWFSMKGFRSPSSVRSFSNLTSEEQVLVKDLDLLRNLELLEEMDTLQKLVGAVDHGNGSTHTNYN